ncbi:MAG: Asp-tRNA(Asn)/Glu-tRNA(Gln) amidotransferase subunit GatA [Bacteroidota bacterium]
MAKGYSSIADLQLDLANGTTTAFAQVQYYLKQIEETGYLNIYVEVFADEAIAIARQQDEARKNGEPLGKLAGVVISIKDVICYQNHRVSAGSKMLENFISPYSATAIERLLAEDAIIIGRTNCDEFAMGSGNENSYYGPTRNAADPRCVPGGSSGGAAVSVQADTCLLALGSSTGGSVRQPASFCGVYGVKPTYGRVSRHGLIAFGSSFDQIGLLGHAPQDLALVLEIIAGADGFDSTSPNKMVPFYSQQTSEGPKKIAYFPSVIDSPGLSPEIKAATEAAMDSLRAAGHELTPVTFDLFDYVVATYYVLTTAEASSNLSRFDGLRYGYRSPDASNLEETYRKSRSEGFGTEVQRRILLGTFVLSSGYYDAYYTRAQKVRRLIRDQLRDILAVHDFIMMPVSPSLPWHIGEQVDDPVANYLADIYTVLANLAGIPGIAIPTGVDEASGLPLGYQLLADNWQEGELLAFAKLLDN